MTVADPDVITLDFDRFDLETYDLFMRVKALPERQVFYDWQRDAYTVTTARRFAAILGLDVGPVDGDGVELAGHLFDYQRYIVERALAARRFAVWADTGLGKTAMFLEWARQVHARTSGGVLIVSPPQVIEQTRGEAASFYEDGLPIERLRTRDDLSAWCGTPSLAITNYEKFIPGVLPELRACAGVVLDESSILKSGGGTIKWNLIKSARGIPYKLSCTATPAPNDTMEYASQASFLERLRSEGEILWTWFSRDKRGTWRVKPHARDAFYAFMASWSIYLRDPAGYGFDDILATLPPPEIHEERIPITEDQRARMHELLAESGRGLFDERLGVRERTKLSQLAKGFLYENGAATWVDSGKPARVAQIVRDQVAAGRPTIVWTVFNEEAVILRELLTGVNVRTLDGDTPDEERDRIIREFQAGTVDVLVSKAQLAGYGLNFQTAKAMVFSGLTDSYEQMYQAIRRAYRFGQTDTVHVHVPIVPELEGMVADNLARKKARMDADVEECERSYRHALAADLTEAA